MCGDACNKVSITASARKAHNLQIPNSRESPGWMLLTKVNNSPAGGPQGICIHRLTTKRLLRFTWQRRATPPHEAQHRPPRPGSKDRILPNQTGPRVLGTSGDALGAQFEIRHEARNLHNYSASASRFAAKQGSTRRALFGQGAINNARLADASELRGLS